MSPGSYFCWSYNYKAKTVNYFKTYFTLLSKIAKFDSDLLKAYEDKAPQSREASPYKRL